MAHHSDTASQNDSSDEDGSGSDIVFDQDSDTEEYGPQDFAGDFVERDERLFHSHVDLPYPLPCDTPEQQRLNVQHKVLFEILGAHYPPDCPVPNLLAPDPARTKVVLDLCTGTGKWVIDMARAFPHVSFRGLDIVPIAPQRYHDTPKIQFIIHDVNTQAPWNSGTFDIVHARSVSMATPFMPALVVEAARLLRPNGCFISGEWSRMLYTFINAPGAPGPPQPTAVTAQTAPWLTAFFAALHAALTTPPLPLPFDAPPVAPILAAHPMLFDPASITARTHMVPLGGWPPDLRIQRTGRAFRNVFRAYMESVRPLLTHKSGLAANVLQQIYTEAKVELRHTGGLVALYNTVFARRV
ncbi:Methyltransf-25 domain-containing protein [Mycena kentingensis (nom. inval.)]|nr:Methyltransf-25 domain-containing protein [Mycena kentingensis (nom. inval.)]